MTWSCEKIVSLIEASRVPISTERHAQDGLEDLFRKEGLLFEREVSLSTADRIDFMVCGKTGIEVKIGHPKRQVLRQLERYAKSDRIDTLILVTSAAFPRQGFDLNGKKVSICNLSMGWL